ncbi:Zinc finger double-stranded RNA binding [Trinorchestia longiramus]|nr:Zinc finger double-stranded RNA binding [Trinorchestia longiramus]
MGHITGRRKGNKKKINRNLGKRWKTKYWRTTKDIDQIDDDLAPHKAYEYLNQKADPEKPGDGQNYCLLCGTYFINKETLVIHLRTKNHKKRVRELQLEPHSQEEADRAAGMGNFIMPEERIVRDLTADDQVRDADYVAEKDEEIMKEISKSMSTAEPKRKKRKHSMFIEVKSKASATNKG